MYIATFILQLPNERRDPTKTAATLESIPKEIVFLIDASLSINEHRLASFKKGIKYCLENLYPHDRFNILTFKDTITRFRPESVLSDAVTVQEALRFLGNMLSMDRIPNANSLNAWRP